MFARVMAWWAKSQRKSELRVIRKTYIRKTGVSLDEYTDEELEQMEKIGALLRKHKISADDVIKYLLSSDSGEKNAK